jgi:hypothetical protein
MKHITEENPRRITTYPGETSGEYTHAREKAEDITAFEAKRLVHNGWTAALEQAYQANAAKCGVIIQDGEKLYTALQTAEQAQKDDQEKRRQARATVQAKLAQPATQTGRTPQRAPQEPTAGVEAPPEPEDGDPGIDISFEPTRV